MRQKDDNQGSVGEGLPEASLLMEGDTKEAAGRRLQGRQQLLGLLGSCTPGRCVPNTRQNASKLCVIQDSADLKQEMRGL